MAKLRTILVALLAGFGLSAGTALEAEAPLRVSGYTAFEDGTVALVGVTILDGTGGPAVTDQTIIVRNGRIAALGCARELVVPAGAKTLHLEGHTVIPGLVGMHDHTHMPGIEFMGYTATRLWLASGVTTVETAGSADTDRELALAQAIAEGWKVGPTIFPTAHYITGQPGNASMTKPRDTDDARQIVRRASERGATWFKLYRHIEPDIAEAVIDEAHALGRKVTGHLCSLTFRKAAELGIDSIEHGLISATDFVPGREAGTCTSNAASLATLDMAGPEVAALIKILVDSNVTLTSTLAIIESHFPHRPQADERSLALMSPAWRTRYDARQALLRESASTSRYTPQLLNKFMAFERAFVAAGGRLAMGPDSGRHIFPGFGNQRGFELLVEAGFSIPEAVRIATLNGATTLGIEGNAGSIALGYKADLVVLRGDLMQDTSVIRNVVYTFKDGIAFDPQSLLADVQGQVGIR